MVEDLRIRLVQDGGCSTEPIDPGIVTQGLAGFGADAQAAGEAAWDQLAAVAPSCDADRAAWAQGIATTVKSLSDLEQVLGTSDQPLDIPTFAGDADIRDVSALAVAQFDRLHQIIVDPAPAQASPHWLGAGEAVVVKGLRQKASTGEAIDVVIIGDSLAKHGIDVPVLRNSGIDVFNAAVAAASETAQVQLLDTSRRLLPQVSTIVWELHTHRMFIPCGGPDPRFNTVLAARDSVFMEVSEAVDVDPYELILGSDPMNPQRSLAGYNLTSENDSGNGGALEGRDAERIELQLRTDPIRYDNPTVCQERINDVGDNVAALVADGLRVVIVVAPQSQQLADLHPEGRAAHAAVVADMQAVVTDNGGELLDLSTAVDDSDFYDLTHVNAAGRVIFTQEVAAALQAD